MQNKLSVVMITKNADRLLAKSLESVKGLADEIIIIDNNSDDNTVKIAKKFNVKIYSLATENLGEQKEYGVTKTKNQWVLILDSDEIVTNALAKEIKNVISKPTKFYGFKIPYQNHLFGRPIFYGGENYNKLVLFKKQYATIKHRLVHENFLVKNHNYGLLKNKILHYSYPNLYYMFAKFTDYAIREARQRKQNAEKSSLKKIFAYPSHMFYARYIKDKGYKDYWARIFLDLGFAYMEFATYLFLAILNLKK